MNSPRLCQRLERSLELLGRFPQNSTISPIEFAPGVYYSTSRSVYTCVQGFGGIGLGLDRKANTATDGSREWILGIYFSDGHLLLQSR